MEGSLSAMPPPRARSPLQPRLPHAGVQALGQVPPWPLRRCHVGGLPAPAGCTAVGRLPRPRRPVGAQGGTSLLGGRSGVGN